MLTLLAPLRIAPSPIGLIHGEAISHPERLVRRGELVRVRPGVFASATDWAMLMPWERYLAGVHAVALVAPDAVFGFESAAVLSGLPVFGNPGTVHVMTPEAGQSRVVAGVRSHTFRGDRALAEAGGLLLTSVADTAVDLARTRHAGVGLAVANAALRLDPTIDRATLIARNESRISPRGRALARWALERSTPTPESALESISLAAIEWLGFPAPELQIVFHSPDGTNDRLDFLWRSARIGGEADGDLKYDGRFGTPSEVLRRQSARDVRLRRHLRQIVHFGWTEATTFAPLRGMLLGAGLIPEQSEDTAQLFTLRRAVSPRPTPRDFI